MIRASALTGFVGALLVSVPGCYAQPAPAGIEAPKPDVQPVAPAGEIKTADELLTRLETADMDIKSLEADMLYDRVFGLVGDRQIRKGKLYYVDTKAKDADGKPVPGSRKFAIPPTRMGRRPIRDCLRPTRNRARRTPEPRPRR